MPTPYYQQLLQDLSPDGAITQLVYDVQNAPPAMREITTKLFNVVTNLLYHNAALTEELVRLNVLQRQQATPLVAPAPTPQAAPATVPRQTALPMLSLPRLGSPASGPSAAPNEITPCDVAQVVITAQGTKVIPPVGTGAAPVTLPPNTPVSLEQVVMPPPAPDGVNQVVLPRGGALPPEVQAALNNRQGSAP